MGEKKANSVADGTDVVVSDVIAAASATRFVNYTGRPVQITVNGAIKCFIDCVAEIPENVTCKVTRYAERNIYGDLVCESEVVDIESLRALIPPEGTYCLVRCELYNLMLDTLGDDRQLKRVLPIW